MVLKLEWTPEILGRPIKTQMGPPLRLLIQLVLSLRICISNEPLGDADIAGWGPQFENQHLRGVKAQHFFYENVCVCSV